MAVILSNSEYNSKICQKYSLEKNCLVEARIRVLGYFRDGRSLQTAAAGSRSFIFFLAQFFGLCGLSCSSREK